MLTVSLSGSEAFKRLETQVAGIAEAVRAKVDLLNIKLQSHIVSEKLSGQVLKHRTGTLANSIRVIPARAEGGEIVGEVQGAGGPAWYGRLHEYGTTSSFVITARNKKSLAFMVDGKQIFAKSVVHPPFMERSFMRSSAAEMTDEIKTSVQATVDEAIQ